MKKNLFYYMLAVLCTVTLFTSCSDDNGGDTPNPVNPLVGTYGLADYTTEDFAVTEGENPIKNFPISGPLYAEWEAARVDYWRMERAFVMAGKVRFEDAQACRSW